MILELISLLCVNQRTDEIFGVGKKLKKAGCYDTGKRANGHPLWFSPKTGNLFKTSNHKNQEVAKGTLQDILKKSGLK